MGTIILHKLKAQPFGGKGPGAVNLQERPPGILIKGLFYKVCPMEGGLSQLHRLYFLNALLPERLH
jgi:hypothetical protein